MTSGRGKRTRGRTPAPPAAATVPDPCVLIIRLRVVLGATQRFTGIVAAYEKRPESPRTYSIVPVTRVVHLLLPSARQGAIVAVPFMRRLILASVVVLIAVAATPAAANDGASRSQSMEQVEFGIKVAQNGLWNEALYRWQKAVELDPSYAAAWNNLAIAYEHEGKFDLAKKAYEKALQLDPKNLMIRQNYDLFKEINDRTKRRSGK